MADRPCKPYYITATGDVGSANGGEISVVVLTPAAAVSTLVLREGGSGGTIIAAFQAAASGNSVAVEASTLVYSGQLHATLSGSGAVAMIGI